MFSRANKVKVDVVMGSRRVGDPSIAYADPRKTITRLHWRPQYFLEDMVTSAWHWYLKQDVPISERATTLDNQKKTFGQKLKSVFNLTHFFLKRKVVVSLARSDDEARVAVQQSQYAIREKSPPVSTLQAQ